MCRNTFQKNGKAYISTCSIKSNIAIHVSFIQQAENINVYGAFLHNYGRATDAVRKCCANSTKFGDITRNIACRGQPMSLEDLLHKPVARVQKNALVLHVSMKLFYSISFGYFYLYNFEF